MNHSPEEESVETRMIKHQWQEWNNLVNSRGKEDYGSIGIGYEFVIDRRAEDTSIVTADKVSVIQINEPLEEWTNTTPQIKSEKGEEWIQITVEPKNPYKLKLGVFSERGNDYYYTEMVEIFLSNKGRAFEKTIWLEVLRPDTDPHQLPDTSRLKRFPKPEEIQVQFGKEPEDILTEPFQPLKGQNLERLGFLSMSVKSGNIIE